MQVTKAVAITLVLGLSDSAIFKKYNQQGLKAQGTLLKVLWQPGLEGRLGEDGYMYIYG